MKQKRRMIILKQRRKRRNKLMEMRKNSKRKKALKLMEMRKNSKRKNIRETERKKALKQKGTNTRRIHLGCLQRPLRGQLQEMESQLACMASLSLEAIQCRMATKSYALYLIEQWLQFQIRHQHKGAPCHFRTAGILFDICDQSALEDRAKIAEFYLHNMALTDMNIWDHNEELGDLKLMALASSMNHEKSRAAQMKRILAREKNEPLFIRTKQSNPIVLISTHNLIANNPQLAPRYLTSQEQAISHFEDMFRLLRDDNIHAY